jgi:sterol desaturase/sphingolipid hydroxylase (fatty acid hydroxylase superfamily)
MNFIDQYFWVFSIFLLPALYIIVATAFYLIFYAWKKIDFNENKIQANAVSHVQLRRELIYSAVSLAIFCLTGLVVFLLYQNHLSEIYLDITNRSLAYFFLSILLMILFHDMYFYWTHRLLHLPGWYQKVHSIHHRSSNPSPFTSLAFHPIEAVIQGLVLPLMVLIIPLHPFAIFAFLIYMVYKNVRGHAGFEFTTADQRKKKWNQVHSYSIHHNLHHLHGRDNYGLYFTIWDRVMRTFRKEE